MNVTVIPAAEGSLKMVADATGKATDAPAHTELGPVVVTTISREETLASEALVAAIKHADVELSSVDHTIL